MSSEKTTPATSKTTTAPGITQAQLKGMLVLWVAATVNSDVYNSIQTNQNGERAQIAGRTGLTIDQVNALVAKAAGQNILIGGNHLFDLTASAFPPYIDPVYPGGHVCGSLIEVLDTFYSA